MKKFIGLETIYLQDKTVEILEKICKNQFCTYDDITALETCKDIYLDCYGIEDVDDNSKTNGKVKAMTYFIYSKHKKKHYKLSDESIYIETIYVKE